MGVEIITNTKIGVDIPFETIRMNIDAVLLGIGAWISTGTGCPGEDADGVIGGIDFLRKVVRNEPIELGKKVAIVGGGNTAMDACRTAVRLGADGSLQHLQKNQGRDACGHDRDRRGRGRRRYLQEPDQSSGDRQGRERPHQGSRPSVHGTG